MPRVQNSSAELIDGHAWISVTRNGVTEYYGLWPDNHPDVEDNGKGTDIRVGLEAGLTPTASRYYELTPEQAKKLEASLKENITWGYTNTCASWASQTVKNVTGQKVDGDEFFITDTPRKLIESINSLERERATSLNHPLPPIKQNKSSSWNLFGENSQVNQEIKDIYTALHKGLSDDLIKAGAENFVEPMLAATTHACVEKGISADKIDLMGIDTKENKIIVMTKWGLQIASVDAIEASKVNPQETLQAASVQQEEQALQQQNLQLAQQHQYSKGPSIS